MLEAQRCWYIWHFLKCSLRRIESCSLRSWRGAQPPRTHRTHTEPTQTPHRTRVSRNCDVSLRHKRCHVCEKLFGSSFRHCCLAGLVWLVWSFWGWNKLNKCSKGSPAQELPAAFERPCANWKKTQSAHAKTIIKDPKSQMASASISRPKIRCTASAFIWTTSSALSFPEFADGRHVGPDGTIPPCLRCPPPTQLFVKLSDASNVCQGLWSMYIYIYIVEGCARASSVILTTCKLCLLCYYFCLSFLLRQ